MKTFLKRLRASAHTAGYGWVIPITESDPSGKHVTFTWNAGSERDGDERSVTALMVGSSLESVLVVDGDITLERSATFDSLSGCLYTLILPQRVPILDARTYDRTQDCPS